MLTLQIHSPPASLSRARLDTNHHTSRCAPRRHRSSSPAKAAPRRHQDEGVKQINARDARANPHRIGPNHRRANARLAAHPPRRGRRAPRKSHRARETTPRCTSRARSTPSTRCANASSRARSTTRQSVPMCLRASVESPWKNGCTMNATGTSVYAKPSTMRSRVTQWCAR